MVAKMKEYTTWNNVISLFLGTLALFGTIFLYSITASSKDKAAVIARFDKAQEHMDRQVEKVEKSASDLQNLVHQLDVTVNVLQESMKQQREP